MELKLSTIRAHTPGPDGKWEFLDKHLNNVAEKANGFAEEFDAKELACLIGFFHDLGKINPAFQDYLNAQVKHITHKTVPHAIWGAAFAYHLIFKQLKNSEAWKEVCLPIYGHHMGLMAAGNVSTNLEGFLADNSEALNVLYETAKQFSLPPFCFEINENVLYREVFIRMLFSSLVDADYLATEEHFEPQNLKYRKGGPEIKILRDIFQIKQNEFLKSSADTTINKLRKKVYDACINAGKSSPSIFRLTVPTGGGKTRSSLGFALEHAIHNNLRRIIVALPYTSIIDQTVKVYRDILGADAVLEHHSQMQVSENEDQDKDSVRQRLISENWDAPIIVTTTVQLFESLFSNRASKVRKLHRIVKSIIILDEVQTLPPELLSPTLNMLRLLVEKFGVTVVLSTATQPVFENTPYLKELQGLPIREIIPDYKEHFAELKRVNYIRKEQPIDWDELAEEIKLEHQVMVVLNTRKDALALLDALKQESYVYHLSSLLCGAHRRQILEEVKNRLQSNNNGLSLPVKLVSTQVVEAGVDLDFPVVYRAIGPLDRIVQAAGRCNREGNPNYFGKVIIFEPSSGGVPRGPYKIGLEKAKILLQGHDPQELHNPEIYVKYFQSLFSGINLDRKQIQLFRMELDYPEVASRYRLIQQDTAPVLVDWEDSLERLKDWQKNPSWKTWQALQPFLINLYCDQIKQYHTEGIIVEIGKNLYQWVGKYDKTRGIADAVIDPSDLIQ